jgi:hypothetical protein
VLSCIESVAFALVCFLGLQSPTVMRLLSSRCKSERLLLENSGNVFKSCDSCLLPFLCRFGERVRKAAKKNEKKKERKTQGLELAN